MSINVTVHGSPIKLSRGPMVTVDCDHSRKEFQRRRLLRLEQVRRQSRDIAETVRHRVRKSQDRELSAEERHGEEEHKKWQAKKLLRLQQEYEDCLRDLGAAHDEAFCVSQDDTFAKKADRYNRLIKDHSKHAFARLHHERQHKEQDQQEKLERKNRAKVVEDKRSKQVAELAKRKFAVPIEKKRKMPSKSDSDNGSNSNLEYVQCQDEPPIKTTIKSKAFEVDSDEHIRRSPKKIAPIEKRLSPLRDDEFESITCPIETRISDRIRSRSVLQDGNDDKIVQPIRITIHSSRDRKPTLEIKEHEEISRKTAPPLLFAKKSGGGDEKIEKQELKPTEICGVRKIKDQLFEMPDGELPTIPTVTLRSKPFSSQVKPTNKVKYYDHSTKQNKEYIATPTVQRISRDTIEVGESSASEVDVQQQMFQRDKDAETRGQIALKRIKIRKDYNDLMKRLPILQKQERMATIPKKLSSFPISEDRLKELEMKRQARMESAYEKLFPNSRLITLPSNLARPEQLKQPLLPFQSITVNEKRSLNVGSWDFDFKLQNNAQKKSAKVDEGKTLRKKSLEQMLQTLQFQRDKLAKELSFLPPDSKLNAIKGELEEVDHIIKLGRKSESRKRSRSSRKGASRKKNGARKDVEDDKDHNAGTSDSSLSPPAKFSIKKSKSGQQIVSQRILQNISTQTLPVEEKKMESSKQMDLNICASQDNNKIKEKERKPAKQQSSQTKAFENKSKDSGFKLNTESVPNIEAEPQEKVTIKETAAITKKDDGQEQCSKCYTTTNDRKELCEIVIKIREDDKPKICINPLKLDERQIIIKTESKGKEQVGSGIKVKIEKSTVDWTEPKAKSTSSWREFLNQNSSTSTSYFSPPSYVDRLPFTARSGDPFTSPATTIKAHSAMTSRKSLHRRSNSNLFTVMHDKPQQKNVISQNSSASSTYHSSDRHHLTDYIKKLLTMSRKNIDDLPVSSTDVDTPPSSIVNIHSNVPTVNSFLQQLNLNMDDLENILKSSQGERFYGNNVAETLTISTSSISVSSQQLQDELDEYSVNNFPGVLTAYNKLAENCAKRIENLADMIEKVRLEKINILRSTPVDSDLQNSTEYLDLPNLDKDNESNGSYESIKHGNISKHPPESKSKPSDLQLEASSSCEKTEYIDFPGTKQHNSPDSATEQKELEDHLLKIDYSFADKLKKMSAEELKQNYPSRGYTEDVMKGDMPDNLIARFQNLKQQNHEKIQTSKECSREASPKRSMSPETVKVTDTLNLPSCVLTTNRECHHIEAEPDFEPMLEDIPREPLFPSVKGRDTAVFSTAIERISSKPPPSKGLIIAKKFNSNISVVPHELSTIAETDSVISTKLPMSVPPYSKDDSSKKKNCSSSTDSLPSLPGIFMELLQADSKQSLPFKEIQYPITKGMKSGSVPQNEQTSQDSSDEIENMETTLRNLGMGWAVATLHKTQESLALASSSSSTDLSVKVTSSTSELSLQEVFDKQMAFLSKSQVSIESQPTEVSVTMESDSQKTTRRTSTPVQSSRSLEKSNEVAITGESDLSPIMANSDNGVNSPLFSLNENSMQTSNNHSK